MEKDQHLEQLYHLSVAIGTTLDLEHETAAFMDWLMEAVGPSLAALFITDEAKQELRLMGAHGFEPPAEPRLPLGLDLWRWLAEQGASVPEEDDSHRYAVPIPIEQQLFGTLCLVSRRPADALPEEQRLVKTAAGYLAPVLRNIWRYQTLEQRVVERTAALQDEVAERRQAEEALRRSEGRYRSLIEDVIDASAVGIFILDNKFQVVWVNQALEQFFGLRRDKVIGQDKRKLIRERIKYIFEDADAFAETVLATYDDNTYVESFECHVLPHGEREERWLEHRSRPIQSGFYAGGRVELYYDITGRKRAEEALKEYSERLEEMVEERTRELKDAQERLLRQERLATLGQLAGSVAHELRNPLAVINNIVYLLRLTLSDAPETVGEYLDLLSSEVRNAEAIIADLLSFSAVAPPEREPIAVFQLVASVLERQPPPEGVEVTTRVPPHLPPVYADPRQMRQVLTNLVANAYQAMPDGGRLTVEARVAKTSEVSGKLPKSEGVAISVADTGTGISPENMGKLFEPLFTTRARGIGLGLAISRRFVEANEGCIEVESEEGKGSTFTVYLPASSDQSMYEVKAGVEPLGGVPAEASTPLD